MYNYGYIITNNVNNTVYVGITKDPHSRWLRHQSIGRNPEGKGRHSHLYSAMRKYGVANFSFVVAARFDSRFDCERWEVNKISYLNSRNTPNYNLHPGGSGGHDMRTSERYEAWRAALTENAVAHNSGRDAWIEKLKVARQGRTPALGMSHTPENKALAKEVSDKYWDTQDTYARDPEALKKIFTLSHKEAKKQFGISTTHYYRLKKRFVANDSE